MSDFGPLAQTTINNKYAQFPNVGDRQSWPEIAYRVASNVLASVNAPQALVHAVAERIEKRQILPGGRYLYAAGRPYHQVQNCLLMRAEDSREGWADTMQNASMALMSGAGIGIEYSRVRPKGSLIRRTGGEATGPTALMQMVNEAGRHIMQGGSRRSAIWGGLGWDHSDIFNFIGLKNWSSDVKALKAKDFNFPAPLDGTNISVRLDGEFFKAYHDTAHPKHTIAQDVYWKVVRQMLETGEPGFSIDCGDNEGEILRNAPICADTHVLTRQGYQPVINLVGIPTDVWTGKQWASDVIFSQTKAKADIVRVSMTGGREIRCDLEHPFFVERYHGKGDRRKLISIDKVRAGSLQQGDILHVSLPPTQATEFNLAGYTLGYLYGDGSFGQNGSAEITFCTDASKECANVIAQHPFVSSVTDCDGRGYTRIYFKTLPIWKNRDKAVFPTHVYFANRDYASSFVAGLLDSDGNGENVQKRFRISSKHEGFLRGVARLLEQHGILAGVSKAGHSTYGQAQTYQLVVMSEYNRAFAAFVHPIRVRLDLDGYESYRQSVIKVLDVELDGQEPVYCADVKVAEHSFVAEGVVISNCTEITSADDSDICNLGSINMARIHTLEDMKACVELATALLVAGTVYSDVPYGKVDTIRTKNRRLGLGLMGVHEWLILHGKEYGPDDDLAKYLSIYEHSTRYARQYEDQWGLSYSLKTRAIAPTGTIGIVAETTTGMEPIFCTAFKRRYLNKTTWEYQYVVESVAKRLVEQQGISPDSFEDAYSISPERRVAFQAWLQQYVDHGISSTINLPAWGSAANNEDKVKAFGDMLIKYLPQLRGITCYPDGARSGQPLTPVSYDMAMLYAGEVFVESTDVCDITKGGSCGS